MTKEKARREIDSLDFYLQNHTDDYSEESHTAMVMAIKALEKEPTRKKGKWLNKDASGYHFYGKCSECGQEFCVDAWYTQNMKFCPNCGTKMDEN